MTMPPPRLWRIAVLLSGVCRCSSVPLRKRLPLAVPWPPQGGFFIPKGKDLMAFNLQAERERRNALAKETRRSEEHTSELQSLMRISYAVFCLKQKTTRDAHNNNTNS